MTSRSTGDVSIYYSHGYGSSDKGDYIDIPHSSARNIKKALYGVDLYLRNTDMGEYPSYFYLERPLEAGKTIIIFQLGDEWVHAHYYMFTDEDNEIYTSLKNAVEEYNTHRSNT